MVNPEHGHHNRWHNAEHGWLVHNGWRYNTGNDNRHNDGHRWLVYFEYNNGRRHYGLDHGHGRNVDHDGWLVHIDRRFLDKHRWLVHIDGRFLDKHRLLVYLDRWLFEQHGRFFYFNRRFFL